MKEKISEFLNLKSKEIKKLAEVYPERKSLIIEYEELEKFDLALAGELLNNSDATINLFEETLADLKGPMLKSDSKFYVRFINLPASNVVQVKHLASEHITKFITVEGLVNRIGDILPKVSVGKFVCNRCGNEIWIDQPKAKRTLTHPVVCTSCDRRDFRFVPDESKFIDIQRMEIQESLEILKGGEQARKVEIWVEEDMTDRVTAGDKVIVNGILRLLQPKEKGSVYFRFIDANYIEAIEKEFEDLQISDAEMKTIKKLSKDPKIYDDLIDSIAPSIYGFREVKEAIVLQLFSGRHGKKLPDGTHVRPDIHLLLIGDPGVAKSRLLQYVDEIAPKSVYVSGKSTSAGGLTAIAEKDELAEGAWTLKAGALVIAGGGIACLHPENNIIINDKVVPVGEFFNNSAAYKACSRDNKEIVEINDIDAYVPSFNVSGLTVEKEKTAALRKKRYAGKIIEFVFESGFNLKLTPEHLILDGSTLEWMRADNFSAGDFAVSPLKLPGKKSKIYLLDIIPGNWRVSLSKKEKQELKNIILKKYKSLAEFSKKFGLSRHILSSDSQFSAEQFKKIIFELNLHDEWKNKKLHYARKFKPNFLNITHLTPELGYVLGFIYGDGHVKINKEYIEKFTECWESVFGKKPNVYKRKTKSVIRGNDVESENVTLYGGSILLGGIYEKFVGNALENILLLPDDVLSAFIAGVMDADGCISIKNGIKDGKKYKTVHAEFLLSNERRANLNFMLALRRFDCYSKLITRQNVNVQSVRITGRKDILILRDAIKKHSVKASKEIPGTINDVSGAGDKLPAGVISEISQNLCKINKTTLLNKGIWSTLHAYKEKKYLPSRGQLEKIRDILCDELTPETNAKIEPLLCRDFFLDKIKTIKEHDFDGFVYDLHVPGTNNFVAEGIFVHNCIDEFDKMAKEDQSAMHEAMEQQSYHPDTKIMFADGAETKIGDFVDELMSKHSDEVVDGVNCQILPLEKIKKIDVFTTDFGKIYPASINRVSRHTAPGNFIKIRLQNGRDVAVTPEHPCWVVENGRISTKRADELTVDDFLPVPVKIPLSGETQYFDNSFKREGKKDLVFPKHNSPEFCRLLGYLIGDGSYELNRGERNGINFYNKNPELIRDFSGLVRNMFSVEGYHQKQENTSRTPAIRYVSKDMVNFFDNVDLKLLTKGKDIRIPPNIMKSSLSDVSQLLKALFECDGHATKTKNGARIGLVSESQELSYQVQTLLLRFGIYSTIFTETLASGNTVYRNSITGYENISKFSGSIGFISDNKNKKLSEYPEGKRVYRTLTDLIPNCGGKVSEISKTLKLHESKIAGEMLTDHKTKGTKLSRMVMKRIVNEFENKIKEIESALEYLKKDKSNPSNPSNQSLSNLINLRKSLNFSQQQISDKLGVIRQTVSYRELNGASSVNSGKYHTALLELCDDALKVKNDVETLKKLAYGDVLWAKITGIENIPNDGVEWVYDVTVEPNQTFISGNMVLHNTISVAKAGIIAKFRANTSILAAANPKFSRFDPYKSLVDQFDIPPTLLSRFDLIFPIRDVLDREQDRKIAQHILKMHKGDKELDEIKPKIERELFKKYIAYCRVNVHPVLSDDAADKIEEYYVTLRSSGVQGRVPATARQLEALVRLSESSAKTRLSNAVTVSDVERAIQLTNFIMKELATDETGAIDIDRIMTEHPKTDRDKIYAVENIVRAICQEREDKLAPIEEIMEKAEESKIDKGTANKILNELKIKGILFEPRNDKWKWVG